MDLISIGITCYNAEDTVERAVRSAQAQTWGNLEIIAVDDCSNDGSWPVLERLANDDRRVRIVRHRQNHGVGRARNTILEHARGAFVAFFDDDDVSSPDRLAAQHRRIVAYEQATGAALAACYTATTQRYPDGTTVYAPALGMDATPAPSGQEVARLILLGKPPRTGAGLAPTCSLMARREVYDAVGGFDANLRRHEDTDFNLRLALRGAHFPGLAAALVTQSMTFTADKRLAAERRSALDLIEKHRATLERWHWYEFSRLWCEMKFAWFDGGVARALPWAARMAVTAPLKTARKLTWSLPNRKHYRRYDHTIGSGGAAA